MVKGQLTTMAESFINQVKRTSSIKTYEYEDFLIKGEVKNAKNMITKAIKVQNLTSPGVMPMMIMIISLLYATILMNRILILKTTKTISPTLELAVIVTLIFGLFNDTYEEVSLTVLKWMVSLSW